MCRSVKGCGKSFAMKCFVILWCTCSALYCSYFGCLYLWNTQGKRHCFDNCVCNLFQASKLGLLVSCRPNRLHHDNSIPILKSHSQMFCEHILGDRLFFQPYVLTLHSLGLWNQVCQSTPIIIWKQNTPWIMESSQSLLSKGEIRVLKEVYAIFQKTFHSFYT